MDRCANTYVDKEDNKIRAQKDRFERFVRFSRVLFNMQLLMLFYIVTTFSRNSVTVRNCDKPMDVFLGKWLAINAQFDGSAAT